MALKDVPESWLFKAIRWTPKIWVVIVASLVLGLNLKNFVLEQVVSYLPQLMIVVAGLFLVSFSLYSRLLIRDGWVRCKNIVGWGDLSWVAVAFLLSGVVLLQSFNIVHQTPLELGIGQPLRIATYNKWIHSTDISSSGSYFLTKSLDVLVMQETTQVEADQMAAILGMPHSYQTDCGCSAEDTDLFILSMHELAAGEKIFENANGVVARVILRHKSLGDIAIYGAHLPVPYTTTSYSKRAEAYQKIEAAINQEQLPTVLMGDFNTTIFSPHWQEFRDNVSQNVYPLIDNNWPACSWYGFGDAGCLRIDYIFVSLNMSVQQLEVGEPTRSDHRSITATIQLN